MSDDKTKGPDLRAGIRRSRVGAGGLVAGRFGDDPVVLVDDGGRLCAWSGECTHHGAPLGDGLLVDGTLRCPWHHARFSVASGEAIAAPAFKPLVRYDVEERDGKVFVTGKTASHASTLDPVSTGPRVVIVGGGAAGYACAEMLDRRGLGQSVTVISEDPDEPYDRTECSKQYLSGDKPRAKCTLADPRFFRDGGPVLRAATTVSRIEVARQEVVLDDGERLSYDVLVLATGAEPVRPQIPGFDRPDVHVLRTLADADALIAAVGKARAGKKKRAVVVGASFIGLEAAAALTKRKVEVHVVAPDDVPLRKTFGSEVGTMIRGIHEHEGVRFHLGRKATAFDGTALILDDGTSLAADFVVLGVGVKPRTDLAKAAGLSVAADDEGGGVVVDEHLQTSAPDIYAIGDIARYPDRYAGAPIRVEHWVHAQRQGQYVARRLLQATGPFEDLPFFWSAHFDTNVVYGGHVGTIADVRVDGPVGKKKFAIEYTGAQGEKAYAACDRDVAALDVEHRWERGI